jgi:hypothetical protein
MRRRSGMIDLVQWSTGDAAGGAGVATATGYSPPIAGEVLAVYLDYVGSPPAGTDFVLSDENDPASESIVSLTDANSDVKIYPRRKMQDSGNTDVTFDGSNEIYEPYVVHGRLEATIAQANNGDSVTVTAWVRR